MGRRGPIPESAAEKLKKGNPGKRSVKKGEPQLPAPEVDAGQPPKRLKGVAANEWNRLYELLVGKGIVHVGNLGVFEEYCFVLGELARFQNAAKKVSPEMSIMKGLVKACASLRQQYRQLARDLRLTEFAGEKIGGEKEEGKLLKFLKAV